MRLAASLSALILVFTSGCDYFAGLTNDDSATGGPLTTIILVRHMERDPGADPPLNSEGLRRRDRLDEALSESGLTAIYTTDLLRNRQSVEGVAARFEITPNLVNPALYANTTVAADLLVTEILRDHAGGTVLFVGNIGSTIPTPGILEEIYRRLGGGERVPTRYEDMYMFIVAADGSAKIVKAAYGGESTLD